MNNSAYWAVAFICLVCVILFWLFKIVKTIWKRTIRLFNKAFQRPESSPTVLSTPVYNIDTRDFARIAYKVGYRHPRTEEILVDGGQVQIRFTSQSGYSIYDAYASFELSGQRFGEYSLRSTNVDSDVPKHIADKIQSEMRKHVGFS